MSSKVRIIKITQQGVFLTRDFFLPWSSTNLPANEFTVKPADNIFWSAEIKDFDRLNARLHLLVIDYYPPASSVFVNQEMKFGVKLLHFDKLNWPQFESFLSTYREIALRPFLVHQEGGRLRVPELKSYRYKIKCYLEDAKFKLGYLSVWTSLPVFADPLELQIRNPHLLPEFEFIKSYFSRALKRKTFEVEVEVALLDDEINRLTVRSKQIEAINDEFIATLKRCKILGLKKNPGVIIVDKHLFSTDDIFDQYDDGLSGNIFKQDPGEILAMLNELGVVRNRKQLEYLAGRKQEIDQKILITLAPHFGFLFTVVGKLKNHFIWELIDSHATYIWSFEKTQASLENQLRKIEALIGLVREHGREKYKQDYQQEGHQQDYLFRSLIHKHADAGIVDGFPNWRYQLEEILE